MKNIVWRTPGADGGRDIEGFAYIRDISGHDVVSKWYVECKLYSSSLDWPTVWNKISYADVQDADVLLIVTNSNPSPTCENKISEWNARKKGPLVRFWRGYDLPRFINAHPAIGVAYGLIDSPAALQAAALPISMIISKLVQSAHTALEFDSDVSQPIEAASALSELLSMRLDDLSQYGEFVTTHEYVDATTPDWLTFSGQYQSWDEVGNRAALTFIRHATKPTHVNADFNAGTLTLNLADVRFPLTPSALTDLNSILVWSGAELQSCSDDSSEIILSQRR